MLQQLRLPEDSGATWQPAWTSHRQHGQSSPGGPSSGEQKCLPVDLVPVNNNIVPVDLVRLNKIDTGAAAAAAIVPENPMLPALPPLEEPDWVRLPELDTSKPHTEGIGGDQVDRSEEESSRYRHVEPRSLTLSQVIGSYLEGVTPSKPVFLI